MRSEMVLMMDKIVVSQVLFGRDTCKCSIAYAQLDSIVKDSSRPNALLILTKEVQLQNATLATLTLIQAGQTPL
jgi:hypothetical protein